MKGQSSVDISGKILKVPGKAGYPSYLLYKAESFCVWYYNWFVLSVKNGLAGVDKSCKILKVPSKAGYHQGAVH